ncbi:MAG TPA: trypsin-like peptidase domain-containing protein [Planctomycetaceae bacterium]
MLRHSIQFTSIQFTGPALVVTALLLASSEHSANGQEPNGLAAAGAIQDAFIKAIETAEKSVVSISRDKRQALMHADNRNLFRGERSRDPADPNWVPNEFGAGVIIDKAGLILTNYHLVRGGPVEGKPDQKSDQTLFVRLADRRGFEARIFAADPRSDLAVLKIPVGDLPAFKLEAKTTPVRKGQFVIALGNPYAIARDGSASATWGIISNISRQAMAEGEPNDPETKRNETIHHLGTLIQLDARLDLGTSGGALLNLHGELIGMTTSLAAIVGYEKSAGFAIPFDDSMKRIIESLRQGKEVEYGFLGVQPDEIPPGDSVAPEFAVIAGRIRRGAARIRDVVPNLPAQRAGLHPGDIVLSVGNKPVFGHEDLVREIGLVAPGTVTRLTIFRPQMAREMEVPVEVGKWPVVDEDSLIATNPLRDPWRGLAYDYSTGRKRFFSIPPTHEPLQGVRIVEVRPGTQAAAKELQPGDLITAVKGVPVRSPREFAEAVKKENGRAVVLTVWTPSDRNSAGFDRNSPGHQVEIKP